MEKCSSFIFNSTVWRIFSPRAPLTEREELTLSLNQLTQIEASLQRAQQSAITALASATTSTIRAFTAISPLCAAGLNIT